MLIDQPTPEGMEEFIVKEATYAIFRCNDANSDAIQKLENSIVMEWLPTSGYEFANAPDIELYDIDGKAEIWIPIKKSIKDGRPIVSLVSWAPSLAALLP